MFLDGEVVVTGTRTLRAAGDAPVATQVVSRDEVMASGARNAGELLQTVAGIQVRRGMRSGDGVSLELQGITPRRVLVLVDGQRVIGGPNGEIDLSRFPVEIIERVEVLRGAASALYGSDALGGVVNIITRRSEGPFHGEATLRYGKSVGESFDEFAESGDNWDAYGAVGFELGPVSNFVSGGLRMADAFDLYPSDLETNGSQVSEQRFYHQARLDTEGPLEFGSRFAYRQRDLRGIESTDSGATYDLRRLSESVTAGLDSSLDLGDESWIHGRVSYAYWNAQYVRDQRNDTAEDRYERSREDLAEASVQYSVPLLNGSQLLTVGVDALHQRMDSYRLGDEKGQRSRVSPFAQSEWTPSFAPSLVVVPGVRVDLDTQYGYAVSPKLNLRYDAHDSLVLRAGVGRGFRAPSFKELLLRFENPTANYQVSGNPDLKPEQGYSANLGAEWKVAQGVFLATDIFRNELRDLIGFELAGLELGTEQFTYMNIASAYTQGAQTTLTLRSTTGVTAVLGYMFTDSWDREEKRRLSYTSPHHVSARIRYSGEGYLPAVSLRSTWSSRAPGYEDLDGDGEEDEVVWFESQTSVDLRLSEHVMEEVEVFLGVDNLVDDGQFDKPLRPRTFYAGLTGKY